MIKPDLVKPYLALYLRKLPAFYLGCLCCYLLRLHFNFSAVSASATIGFLATFLPSPGIQAAIVTGAFVGMCSRDLLTSHPHVVIVSALGTAVYVMTKSHFKGMGGKLGAVAFISSLLLLIVRSLQ